jgi:hypothetical protein
LAFQENFDREEKGFCIGNPLLDSIKFRVKQHVIIGEHAVVLFFRKNLGQVRGQLTRLDEVLTKESSYGPMGGHAHTVRQKCGSCRMQNGVIVRDRQSSSRRSFRSSWAAWRDFSARSSSFSISSRGGVAVIP